MKKILVVIIILLLMVAIFWFWYPIRSLIVMSIYSGIHEKDSIMTKENFSIDIPGGLSTSNSDWYPFVMTFNADSYRSRGNEIQGMTILYNFPAFNVFTRTNTFYEKDSPYNSSFYGAYVVQSPSDLPFCYTEKGTPAYDEIMQTFNYDYKKLVLESLGDVDFKFIVQQFKSKTVDYLGYTDWNMVSAIVETNSVLHEFDGNKRSYLQYGRPFKKPEESFADITMYGRLYMRFFPEYNSTIIMYIMTPSYDILNDCDNNILSKSVIRPQ